MDEVIEILMDVLNQVCQYEFDYKNKKAYLDHRFLSSYQNAFYYLEEKGYLKEVKRGRFKGYYQVLKWK